jgi:excinuclease UvrABC nuclease subunit
MASHHPMIKNANDSDQIAFWVIGSEAEAREMEIKMIKALKPRFNLSESGELKKAGYGQRTQP